MGCVINAAELGAGLVVENCSTISIPQNANFEERFKTMEYNDEIKIMTPSGMYKVIGPGIGGITPVYEVFTLNNTPITDVIIQFFYSYWYIPALIILVVIAVAVL